MGHFKYFEHRKVGHFGFSARDHFENRKGTENEIIRFWGISNKWGHCHHMTKSSFTSVLGHFILPPVPVYFESPKKAIYMTWKLSSVVAHFSGNQYEYFSIWNNTTCFISSNFGFGWILEVWGVESWIISSHSLLSWDWVRPSDDILSPSGIH